MFEAFLVLREAAKFKCVYSASTEVRQVYYFISELNRPAFVSDQTLDQPLVLNIICL